jgi:hypothetical protein
VKWWLVGLIVVIAVVVGTGVSRDPGYLFIAYGEYQLETSVWVALLLVLISIVGVRLSQSLFKSLFGIGSRWEQWRQDRAKAKSQRFVQRAWSLDQVGEVDRATTFLKPLVSDKDWGSWATLMLAKYEGQAGLQSPSEVTALEEAATWLAMNHEASEGQFEKAYDLSQTLPKNPITAAKAVDIALACNDVSVVRKALRVLTQFESLPTDEQLTLIIARAGSAVSDELRRDWLLLLTRLPRDQDGRLFTVLSGFSDLSLGEETARALAKRWPNGPLFLVYGLLAAQHPEQFDRPLKKLRSKASNEDALRLLDAARLEALDPEASLQAYLDLASRVESRLLRHRTLVLASQSGQGQIAARMLEALV